jgi:hypothetical protein
MATAGDLKMKISPDSQASLVRYANALIDEELRDGVFRNTLLKQDLAYYRERNSNADHVAAKTANAAGDKKRIQDPVMPIVGPQVETALAYYAELFLSSYPIFPVVSSPQLIDAAQQIETVLGESAIHFQWVRHLSMAIRDGLKYNLMAAEVEWQTRKVYTLKNDIKKEVVFGVPTETWFEGNSIKRINMYNLIADRRCAPAEIHEKGDYAGYTELMSRLQLKQLFLDLDNTLTMNATDAFQSGGGASTTHPSHLTPFYIPEVNPDALRAVAGGVNWMSWASLEVAGAIKYSDMYEVTTLYVRIIPKEHKILVKNYGVPQIYKLIIVNRQVVIYVQRKTNAHNFLPIVVAQPIEDGHGYQTKSFADNATPYQEIATALYMSAIQSQRRKVYDRLLYDPSKVSKAEINNADAVARIPVKTEAYGRPLSEIVYQIPYRDEGVGTILQFAREIGDMADVATGQNRVQRGQFQKGNKTRYEFDQTMSNSDSRPRFSALIMETAFFQPIKHILKSNILQYQPPTSLYNRADKQQIEIEPSKLREITWQFQIADGMMPSSKLVNMDLFGQVLQLAGAVPAAAAEWDLMGMFAYSLKLQGATWVNDFHRNPQQQQQYMQNVAATAPPGTASPV